MTEFPDIPNIAKGILMPDGILAQQIAEAKEKELRKNNGDTISELPFSASYLVLLPDSYHQLSCCTYKGCCNQGGHCAAQS